jgi:hypothetical protein
MNQIAKPASLAGAVLHPAELSAQSVLDTLAGHKDKGLVFHYGGRDVLPGYHVTEVKTGSFRGLDCGANTESWNETFIQLWDVPEDSRAHMPIWKFLTILRKVSDAVGFDPDARLTFEVSNGIVAMQLYRAERIEAGEIVRVHLSPRPASCKPRDRWLEQTTKQACCGSAAATNNKAGVSKSAACCG